MLAIAGCKRRAPSTRVVTQLNWLHDPTFVAHYRLSAGDRRYENREGGPSVFPIQAVSAGLADAAVCGFDIFAKFVAEHGATGKGRQLRGVFCDFQRNPVGWILHPNAARRLGIDPVAYNRGDPNSRQALLSAIRTGTIRLGDKVGTETTTVLRAWLVRNGLSESARVIPVGFDSSLVQSAPPLLFPVYLNEEPFRIEEKIGAKLLIVDPADSDVFMLGNIVVMRDQHPAKHDLQEGLRDAWGWTRENIGEAAELVSQFYKGVQPETVRRQVAKTVDMAYFRTRSPGTFDLEKDGSVDRSLSMLGTAGDNVPRLDQVASLLG